uniref:Guanine nucleotide exchange factor for Rab-3A n=1 Tax=Cacopsylla melanoneura TaxID=428564 RepID=A0A8D8RDM1_9HEMI
MKTYEPLPLLECIKELTASHPSSPQKSLEMSDDDLDQDVPSLLDEFKSNSPTTSKSYMNNADIQIKTIESEYSQVGNDERSASRNDMNSCQINGVLPVQTKLTTISKSSNACAKSPSHNERSSDSRVKFSQQPSLGKESLSNLNSIKPLQTPSSCCHSNQESHPTDTVDSRVVNGCTKPYCGASASLSNIETLSPYVRTNEFINEILKSPVRPERCVGAYEDQVECSLTEFKDINLNSPLKPSPEESDQPHLADAHLVHLRTLEEIDEDEALCLCSNSVSSTLSSTHKRVACISDSADIDSGAESASSSWERTVAEAKGAAISRLQEELRSAHEELKLKDEEVGRLSRLREEVESELEELTASLFQEAHNMVREANMRQATSEKLLRESKLQVDVLSAEVSALKTLVLTSTPSRPNPHLHPQIESKNSANKDQDGGIGVVSSGSTGLFRKHRRSPSHCNLKYGREDSPPSEIGEDQDANNVQHFNQDAVYTKDCKEVDPIVHQEFLEWRASPTLSKDSPFLSRIYTEDIDPCLAFPNAPLTLVVREAIECGEICIEAVSDKSKGSFPRKCALLEVPRVCAYRMKLGGGNETWYCISKLCRNRITKVCDFLNYLLYIQQGLVKSSAHDVYWEINRLRKEIVLARLGLTKDDD